MSKRKRGGGHSHIHVRGAVRVKTLPAENKMLEFLIWQESSHMDTVRQRGRGGSHVMVKGLERRVVPNGAVGCGVARLRPD